MNPIQLFQGDTMSSAIVLAGASFVVGAVASCVVCKLRGGCKCGGKRDGSAAAAGGERRPAKRQNLEPSFEKKHPAPADGSVEIYVGNLSYDLTEDQLRAEFEAFGKVNYVHIVINRYNGKSKGFGFVHMPDRDAVKAAVAALNDKEILGRKLKCNEAKNVY